MQRRVYRIHKAGNINRLKQQIESLPAPSSEEVTIKVHSIGLNFADVFCLLGLYSATPEGSFIPGLEYSGEVIKTGSNVTNFSQGDKVMGVTRFGGYADQLNIDHNYIRRLPDNWSYREGASFLVQALTAYHALLNLADLKKGNTVLIHSAAGGVGTFANRIAKLYDAYTIGTVGSSSKIDYLKHEGYDDFIVRDSDFKSKLLKAIEKHDLDIVLECIGGKIFKTSYKLMRRNGRLITYGASVYNTKGNRPNYFTLLYKYLSRPKVDPLKMVEQNKSVMGFNLIWLWDKLELLSPSLDHLEEMDIGRPNVGEVFNFDDLLKAVKLFQTGKTKGKVVVDVNE